MASWYGLKNRYNNFLQNLSYHRGFTKALGAPRVHCIELTNHCNIKCVMCPRGEPDVMERSVGHMSLELFEKVIDGIDYFTMPSWFHLFGEPLLNPNLFQQIAIAKKKKKLQLGISTNATLLTEENARKILDSQIDVLMIAIDGATKEVYENVRKSSHYKFDEVTENAAKFLALKKQLGRNTPHVQLSIIVMDRTENELEAFKKTWLSRGANEVVFKPFVSWGGQSQVEGIVQLAKERLASLSGVQEKSPRIHPCRLLWESVVITWDGKVICCCYDYDAKMAMGDLKHQTLRQIWNSPQMQLLRRLELEGKNRSILCASCDQAPSSVRNPNFPFVNSLSETMKNLLSLPQKSEA